MAAQEKHYIEPGDILSLRFDCKHEQCGATLSLPVVEDVATHLLTCPKCNGKWVADVNSANAHAIRAFERAIAGLKADFHFRVYLEIASDSIPAGKKSGQ